MRKHTHLLAYKYTQQSTLRHLSRLIASHVAPNSQRQQVKTSANILQNKPATSNDKTTYIECFSVINVTLACRFHWQLHLCHKCSRPNARMIRRSFSHCCDQLWQQKPPTGVAYGVQLESNKNSTNLTYCRPQ